MAKHGLWHKNTLEAIFGLRHRKVSFYAGLQNMIVSSTRVPILLGRL